MTHTNIRILIRLEDQVQGLDDTKILSLQIFLVGIVTDFSILLNMQHVC